jgi:signal transduction histidine kinase
LNNLIGNAKKYADRYAPPPEISLEEDGDYILIHVRDFGPGLKEEPETLFEFFKRGKDACKKPGFGLGLAYCKMACEAHGGSISAQNNQDGRGGATFTVRLPKKSATKESTPAATGKT